MDSYEECRGPPRLHLLDKFDTGGPGSCLKRYSDPTFFKRVSATSDEANSENLQRDRKARRSKKKRSSKQNGDVSRGGSVSNSRNYSMQFIPPIINGQGSPPQAASTVDTALNYEVGDDLNSFNSRTESGYIECVFHPSSSVQAEGEKLKDSPCFNLAQHNDTFDSVFPDEQVGFVDDNFPRSSLQEQMTSGSSCVTWDEKAEIMESKRQDSGMDEALNIHQGEYDIGPNGFGDGNIGIVDQMEMLDDENKQESVSSQNGIDEIDSEPDNYMDALNTIESESETDLDYQTKREVERFASTSINGGTDRMIELTVHSDHHPTTSESHTDCFISTNTEVLPDIPGSVSSESCVREEMPASDIPSNKELPSSESCVREDMPASDISSNKELPSDLPNSFSLDTDALEQISRSGREFATDHPAVITRSADILDVSKLESVIADASSSATRAPDIQDLLEDKSLSTFCQSQESPAGISSNGSVRFWTNGGLLGLEPSKPPDFAMSSPISPYCINRGQTITVGPLNQTCMLKDEMHGGKLNMSAEKIPNQNDSGLQCSKTGLDDEEDGISSKKMSQGFSANYFDSSHGNNGDCHIQGNDLKETSMPRTGKVLLENDENSSLVFGLSRRLLSNGFGKKVSDVGEDKFERAHLMNDNLLGQRSELHKVAHEKVPQKPLQEQFLRRPIVGSPTASPPLEHMKISFHPVDSFETSKLKLKFSDGTQNNESTRDMFPSFQLIPEPAVPLHDYGSDSDDDTFCRSSPSISDDCLSHHSDSNSEQWECGETTEGKDHEVYDALCGISSLEIVSSSLELGGMPNNGICFDGVIKSENLGIDAEPSLCNAILDLPSFDAMKPALQLDTIGDSNPKHVVVSTDPSPTPPPPPPMEWRVSKPHSDVAEDTPNVASENFKIALSAKLFGSTTSQQPAPASQQQTNEEELTVKLKSKEDQQKLNRQKDINHAHNGKGTDEREDFLQQIRSKSFNLRPTVTTKSTTTPAPGPPASIKVTAILEKANAIRQAVGSDDGEDGDYWSDT
ncbi:hypothetical protein L484_005784 [Morus notabilis]|uniref:Protein SCAR n=2 Tax=Morus notabilis TaxID=981085 RepID=W9RSX7_9ROSA|nr:hypothetical protein L484_005784 [Morus notabilis]